MFVLIWSIFMQIKLNYGDKNLKKLEKFDLLSAFNTYVHREDIPQYIATD